MLVQPFIYASLTLELIEIAAHPTVRRRLKQMKDRSRNVRLEDLTLVALPF